jgi:hypothetical protein
MTTLSVSTDNIAIDNSGAITRGGYKWETNIVGYANKGWTREKVDLKGNQLQGDVFVPMAFTTQWMEPPAANFGIGGVKASIYPMIRLYDLWTTKELTDDFIKDELLHLTDPYIFGIGRPNLAATEEDDGEYNQLILGRARTFVPDTAINSIQLGFNRLIDDTMLGSSAVVGARTLYYTRAYYVYLNSTDGSQFMDMPSQRSNLTGEFVKAADLEHLQTIASNKGVGGW